MLESIFLLLRRIMRGVLLWLSQIRRYLWANKPVYSTAWVTIATVPPYVVNSFFGSDRFAAAMALKHPTIHGILSNNIFVFVALAGVWVLALDWIKSRLKSLLSPEPVGWEKAPIFILKALDQIVGHKVSRVDNFLRKDLAKQHLNGETPSLTTMLEITTKPTAQINRIVESIWQIFQEFIATSQNRKADVKVTLAILEKGAIQGFMCNFPSHLGVKSSFEELNNSKSSFQTAYRKNQMVVISSTLDESEKADGNFVATSASDLKQDGSIICVPIQTADPAVTFVLSIFFPERGIFDKKYRDAYAQILDSFILRIKLEYSLEFMRRLANDK